MQRLAAFLFCLVCFAQTAARPEYDVSTVKPNKSGGPGAHVGTDGPQRFNAENAPLRFLVQVAWKVRGFQIIGGPKWIDADRFNIQAVTQNEVSPDKTKLMLQALLEDRFQLKAHLETREQ